MVTLSEVIPGCKTSPNRSITWTAHPIEAGCACEGTVTIRCSRMVSVYDVTEFLTKWSGRAFQLVKAGGEEAYNVFVARDGRNHECDCAGFAYGRGKPCRHIEAMKAVIKNGWMPHPCERPDDVGNTEVE